MNKIEFDLTVPDWEIKQKHYIEVYNNAKHHFSSYTSHYFSDKPYREELQQISGEMLTLLCDAFEKARGDVEFEQGMIYSFNATADYNALKELHDNVMELIKERIDKYQGK